MAKFYAFYLPQFHPVPENDEWYGKGFTEWRSVAAARPLYPGHYEPHLPADLGFYDLRLKETVAAQVSLANEYGVDGFLYWHYWFGEGRQLLEKPMKDLVEDKSLHIRFAAAWANASWYKKQWKIEGKDKLLMEQQYPGEEDDTAHFYSLLDAFRDERYIRVEDKLLFIVYQPLDNLDAVSRMIAIWRRLAQKEGFPGFYFVGHDWYCSNKVRYQEAGFDAVYDDNMLNIHHRKSKAMKALYMFGRKLHIPTCFRYKDAIQHMILPEDSSEDVIPMVAPNWDHSPRSGTGNIMFRNCDPVYFEELLRKAMRAVSEKRPEHQMIFIKSWNEWGEGNHMEPDLRYGRGYLEAVRKVKNEQKG